MTDVIELARHRPRPMSVEFGTNSVLQAASAELLAATGLTTADLGTATLFDLVHPADIPVVLNALSALTNGVPRAYFEAKVVDTQGVVRSVTWEAERDGDGPIRAAGTDVTEQRMRSNEALRDAETRLRLTLAVAGGGAWDFDPAEDVVWLDGTFATLLGIPDLTPLGSWAELAEYVHPDDRQLFLAAIPTTSRGIDTEIRVPGPDGGVRHIALRGRLVDAGGARPHIVGVAWDVTESRVLEDRLLDLAMRDQLTGLPNRRAFELAVREAWALTRRGTDQVSMLMVDVDDFKRFNDEHGHQEGDAALHEVAEMLDAQAARPSDVVARYGGEEFGVLLPQTDQAGALAIAERMVAACQWPESGPPRPTVSVGVATLSAADESLWDVLRRADTACYEAKAAGKGRAEAA